MTALPLRLHQYQKERFPLAAHVPLVAVLAAAALRLGEGFAWGRWAALLVILAGLFFQLRVADEFKDAETDRRYRPERPVPRGLISLRELAALAGLAAVAQLGLAAALDVALLPWLLLVYAYGAAMTVEFGVGEWLRARPALYLLSHMVMMPLIGLLALRAAGGWPGETTILGFALLCYANGVVLEIGRKIRKPEDEREGVETYSALWGRGALLAWGVAVAGALVAFLAVGGSITVGVVMAALVAGGAAACKGRGKGMELLSALWLLGAFGAVAVGG